MKNNGLILFVICAFVVLLMFGFKIKFESSSTSSHVSYAISQK
jgi:hypothetical protein